MFLKNINCRFVACIVSIIGLVTSITFADEAVTREQAELALRKAVHFFHTEVSSHGGYLWRYSGDLELREGEGKASKTMVWVQPPGTPTVGEVFLDAYEATGEPRYLDAARDAAYALVRGQLRTGGWYYYIEFDPEKRLSYGYRDIPELKKQKQKTMLDDDTTQSALRFLMRMDKILKFKDDRIHEAIIYALTSILRAQYPNGAWYMWWEQYPSLVEADKYPVLKASYPETWSRKWPNDWTGRYFINDDITPDTLVTMLDAYDTYNEQRYLESALRAGEFLLLAQMPEPQPAWAQQYDLKMHPVWDRKFEPPAISSLESQTVLEVLMLLYRKTGKKKYFAPIPSALRYFRNSQMPDGSLARFYELQTNRPLYFTKDYKLTYISDDLPTHYGFIIESRLDSIEAEYRRLMSTDHSDLQTAHNEKPQGLTPALIAQAKMIIDSMDNRGAWVERRPLAPAPVAGAASATGAEANKPLSWIISCQTFVNNVKILCRFIIANK